MSASNLTLAILGIPESNIHVDKVYDEYRGQSTRRRKVHIIHDELSYRLKRCQLSLCGMETLRPKGHRLVHVHIKGATDVPTIIDLNKQHWWCDNCSHSVMAATPLVEANHSIAEGHQEAVIRLAKQRLTIKTIASIFGISSTTVQRMLDANVKYPVVKHLPTNLCFDEFRSTSNMMSFIWINGDTHRLVSLLGYRLNKTIKDFFISQYSLKERRLVQTITMDMNASYQLFIHEVFPNARIIINRFHIIQLLGRALDQTRIATLKQIQDHHLRTYKVLKSQWRLFHKAEPDAQHVRYLMGINEYMTGQNVLDIASGEYPPNSSRSTRCTFRSTIP